MTISTTTNRMDYTGNGATSVYSFTFLIRDAGHLLVTTKVIATSVETTLVIGTDYSVSGVGVAGGGAITLIAGNLASTKTITIRRVVPLTQSTDVRNQGDFFPEVYEDALDDLMMVDQQQQNNIDRSMKLPETTNLSTVSALLPAPSADKLLGWNAGATALENKVDLSAYSVTPYIETLLDDANAAAARVTLDTARAIASLSEKAAPLPADFLVVYDLVGSAEKKAFPGAVMANLSRPGAVSNLGIVNATTTVINDSVKVQGAASALSATNPLHAAIGHSATSGLVSVLALTSDVTIKVTGAHFGLNTFGDFTDIELRVYFINDGSGTLKVGLATLGGLRSIASTSTSTMQASVTTSSMMLVNSALAVGTWPCVEVGWVMANFDDTGGAAEDLWAVSTAMGKIGVGIPVKDKTDWVSYTPTGSWTSGCDYTGRRRRIGDTMEYQVSVVATGGVSAATLTINFPTGHVVDTAKLPTPAPSEPVRLGHVLGIDAGNGRLSGVIEYSLGAASVVTVSAVKTASADNNNVSPVTQINPFTVAAGDGYYASFAAPLLGLSSN